MHIHFVEQYTPDRRKRNILERIGADQRSFALAIKHKYGNSDAPGYWCRTFRRWHVENLKMKPSVVDLHLCYKIDDSGLQGIQSLQVYDTLAGGNDKFATLEEDKSKTFECKLRSNSLPFPLNGFSVGENESEQIFQKKNYCSNLLEIDSTDSENSTRLQKIWNRSRKNRLRINMHSSSHFIRKTPNVR